MLFYKNNILIPDKPEYKLIIYYNSKFDNIQYFLSICSIKTLFFFIQGDRKEPKTFILLIYPRISAKSASGVAIGAIP